MRPVVARCGQIEITGRCRTLKDIYDHYLSKSGVHSHLAMDDDIDFTIIFEW